MHSGAKSGRGLLRLLYVSAAAPALTACDLEAIAESSAARNRVEGLTGLLLHEDGRFLAVLEGPGRRLLGRMERIITDRRHAGVDILLETPVAERHFATWHFGCLPKVPRSAAEDFLRTLRSRLR